MMTRKEAIKFVEPYVAGELTDELRLNFESYLRTDAELSHEVKIARQIDAAMRTQSWLMPSADFTRAVMQTIGLQPALAAEEEPMSKRELVLEWMHGLAPAAAIIAFVAMFGQAILGKMMSSLTWTAQILDSTLGTDVFGMYPAILLGIAALPIGGVIISATVTRHLRLAS